MCRCCDGLPEVCPADLAQSLDVFLTDGVCISGWTALSFPLSPLALWEHMWSTCVCIINALTLIFLTLSQSQSFMQNSNCTESYFSVRKKKNRCMQYPSSPAGQRGWTADVHGRSSPAVGTEWPIGLVSSSVKETTHTNIKTDRFYRCKYINEFMRCFTQFYTRLTFYKVDTKHESC